MSNPLSNPFEKPWVEKYRPKTIEQLILPSETKDRVLALVKSSSVPNMLFHSQTPGTGKTSTALAICNTLGFQTLMINGSNEGRLIDTLRSKIIPFASSVSLDDKKKCVIIDEADYMPEELIQPALRAMIEEFNKAGVVFIFTCNNISGIIPSIVSRFSVIDFTVQKKDVPELKQKILLRVLEILKLENIKIEDTSVLPALIKKYFPDTRQLLNEIQFSSTTGILNSDAIVSKLPAEELSQIVSLLKAQDLRGIRDWCALNKHLSPEVVVRFIYDRIHEIFHSDSIATFIVLAGNWTYKSSFIQDKEIATAAMLTEIGASCEFVK